MLLMAVTVFAMNCNCSSVGHMPSTKEEVHDFQQVKEDHHQGNKEGTESWTEWAKEKITEGLGFKHDGKDKETTTEKVSDTAQKSKDMSKDAAHKTTDYAADTAHKTIDYADDATQKAKDYAGSAAQKTREYAGDDTAMELISGTRSSSSSSLNPNAPMFVPLAYRTVEDFSDQWWALIHSSPWFRDYWLRERFQDPQFQNDAASFSDFDFDFDLDEDDLFHSHQLDPNYYEAGDEREKGKELVTLGSLKWRRFGEWAEPPRYAEKAPKIVRPNRVSPRAIHQPR